MYDSRVLIFGVGALASLFAGLMQKRNVLRQLTLFGHWRQQIRAMNQGLIFRGLDGSESKIKVPATDQIQSLADFDFVLILTKCYQTAVIAPLIEQVLSPNGVVFTLQNGLGNDKILAAHVREAKISQGVTTQAALLEGVGVIRHTGEGPTYLADRAHGKAQLFNEILNACGIASEISRDANSIIWGKLAVNAGINPLTALLEVRNGQLLNNNVWTKVLHGAALEARNVALAQKVQLPYADVIARVNEICKMTSNNFSSMLQDIQRGAKTEIDFICGAIVTAGKRAGVQTPINSFLHDHVRQKELGKPFDPTELNRLPL